MSTKVVRPDPRGGRIGKALSEFLWLEAAGGVVASLLTDDWAIGISQTSAN